MLFSPLLSAWLAAVPLLGMGVTDVFAAGAGHGPVTGWSRPGVVRIGPARVGAGYFGNTRYGAGRLGRYPAAIYGGGLSPLIGAPQAAASPAQTPVLPERLDVWSYSKSVVIHRGPAFGEPGYVSEPVVLHLRPAGPGRFQVEKIRP